jgi:hypothetical protein
MCGAEYGGGDEGGERRDLQQNLLTGPLPSELGELVELTQLCVRPASPPRLAMWGQLPTRGRLAVWVSRVVRGGECSRRGRLAGVSAVWWMCGAEHGGGGVGERRLLSGNQLTGEIPSELGELNVLELLCVRPAPPPHLAMWGQLPTRGRLAVWVSRVVRGGECSHRGRLAGVSAVCVDVRR